MAYSVLGALNAVAGNVAKQFWQHGVHVAKLPLYVAKEGSNVAKNNYQCCLSPWQDGNVSVGIWQRPAWKSQNLRAVLNTHSTFHAVF